MKPQHNSLQFPQHHPKYQKELYNETTVTLFPIIYYIGYTQPAYSLSLFPDVRLSRFACHDIGSGRGLWWRPELQYSCHPAYGAQSAADISAKKILWIKGVGRRGIIFGASIHAHTECGDTCGNSWGHRCPAQ